MKQANEIWRQFKDKKIDAKEAVRRLNVLFSDANGPETAMLSGIYQKILDAELPITEPDKEAEEAFWKATHPEED